MSDELNDELQDSNLVEETVQEPETEVVTDDDPETLKAKIAELEEKNKQLFARAKKVEKPKPLTTNQSSPDSDERFERLELKTEGYSSEEVDFLMQNGGRKALENKIAMAGIEALRKKLKSEQATPSGTAKSPTYQKYTEEDLKNMPLEELKKILPK